MYAPPPPPQQKAPAGGLASARRQREALERFPERACRVGLGERQRGTRTPPVRGQALALEGPGPVRCYRSDPPGAWGISHADLSCRAGRWQSPFPLTLWPRLPTTPPLPSQVTSALRTPAPLPVPRRSAAATDPVSGEDDPASALWSLSRKEGGPTPAGPDHLRPRSRQRPGRLAPVQPTLCTCPETLRWDQTSEGLEHPSHASWRPVQSRVPSVSEGLLCHETVTAPSTATPSNSSQATGVGPISWVFP